MIASQMTHFLSPSRLSNSTLDTFTMSTSKSLVLAFIWILLLSFIFILFVCILGAIVPNKSNTDLNNLKTNGVYQTYSCTNAPAAYGMTQVFYKQGDIRQVFMQVYHSDISIGISPITYVRNFANNAWSDWAEVAINVPSFYKNYSDLAALITGLSGINTDGEFLSHIKRLHNVGTSGTDKTVLAPVYNSTMACYIVTITSRVYYIVVENNATVTTSKLNDAADPAALDGFIVDSGNLCAKWKSSVTFYEIKCLY